MKFIDTAKIYVKAGDGGDGHISFRKEKFAPKGGPDGGSGGKGGDIVIVANTHINTLLDFRYKSNYAAKNGNPGEKSRKTGKSAPDLVIKVPKGTVVFDANTDELICDLNSHDSSFIVAKGGKGGLGNSEFATATNRAPRFAKPGKPGEELDIKLELKLLADVGLVGFPNAGKSTLISVISAAKPKIADYPFTTLIPNLGIVRVSDTETFVVADIPGIIEGASEGKGLGHQFLRHIERTKVLLIMVDINEEDILEKYNVLLQELDNFSPELIHKNKIVAITKIDSVTEERINEVKKIDFGIDDVHFISSISGNGIDKIIHTMWNYVKAVDDFEINEDFDDEYN